MGVEEDAGVISIAELSESVAMGWVMVEGSEAGVAGITLTAQYPQQPRRRMVVFWW